jgi:hypothetical protein
MQRLDVELRSGLYQRAQALDGLVTPAEVEQAGAERDPRLRIAGIARERPPAIRFLASSWRPVCNAMMPR